MTFPTKQVFANRKPSEACDSFQLKNKCTTLRTILLNQSQKGLSNFLFHAMLVLYNLDYLLPEETNSERSKYFQLICCVLTLCWTRLWYPL